METKKCASWRPNGANSADYPDHEHWSYRRWAWEYLRRNQIFQDACISASQIKDKSERIQRKQEIAREFMLRRYKHCSQPYEVGRRPLFFGISTSPKPNGLAEQDWPLTLRHDQVALIFNLRPALHSKTTVDALLKGAKLILQARALHLRTITGQRRTHPTPHLDPEQHLHYLMLLDARNSGMTPIEIARADWYKPRKKSSPKPNVADQIRDSLKSATALTEFGFMALVTAPRRMERMPLPIKGFVRR
jgi:hypothetical protein